LFSFVCQNFKAALARRFALAIINRFPIERPHSSFYLSRLDKVFTSFSVKCAALNPILGFALMETFAQRCRVVCVKMA